MNWNITAGRPVYVQLIEQLASHPAGASLQRLAQEIHIPMLYVSHSLDEIQHLADRVLVLEA